MAGVDDLLLSLPDDVLVLISSHLSPRELSSLSLCSRSLHSVLSSSDKIWLSQCINLCSSSSSSSSLSLLPHWRSGVSSYRSLCRFLLSVSPLLGLWVHQNPELGNLVLLSLGPSLSLLARRVIPQELSPTGGPLLFAPVFEILSSFHGAPHFLFLHGRTDHSDDCLFPGSVLSIAPNSNVLLLEVDSHPGSPPFSRLAFADRHRLLDAVADRVCHRNIASSSSAGDSDAADRRTALLHLHSRAAGGRVDWRSAGLNSADRSSSAGAAGSNNKKSFFSVVRQIIGKPPVGANSMKNCSSAVAAAASSGDGNSKHVALSEFLKGGDTVGLALRATNMRLTTYRAWPNMHDNRFALYKLPLQEPSDGREYAGVWGGTFGWPPGRPSEDKPGKALFFLLLSYEEIAGELHLIATKILEGTHYVLHPNGSAMFIVKVDEPAADSFPWEVDGDGVAVEVKRSFSGEGIANGYGFRYPGSKPGFLFEIHNGMLAFVWKESKAVLTLQRLDLEELLKKGERVPPLPPVANFAYLTKSYSNVFAGFPSSCSPSLRNHYFSSNLSMLKAMTQIGADPEAWEVEEY